MNRMMVNVTCTLVFFILSTVNAQNGKGLTRIIPHKELLGKQAPEWHINGVIGENVKTSLKEYKGKWVLLEFWFPR